MPCNFCRREGLAMLPMRAALMPKNSQFTSLPESIEMPVAAEGETDYTATLLNEGYLYIFNEKKAEWITYYCTEDGYYSLLPQNMTEFKSRSNNKPEPCSDKPLEQANSRLITLPMFNYIGKYGVFWFAWSPVSWTKEVLKRNSDPAVYQTFMQKFDMDAWIDSGKAFNTLPIAQSQSFLNDELIRPPKKVPVHITSWHFFKKQQTSDMVAAAALLSPKRAAMIVLQDPTALAHDISALAEEKIYQQVFSSEAKTRKLNAYQAIEAIKNSVKQNAEQQLKLNKDKAFDAQQRGSYGQLKREEFPIFNATETEITQAREYAWKRYAKFYDQASADAFMEEANQEASDYIQNKILLMKNMHTAWLDHIVMRNHFRYCFDEMTLEDKTNGLMYAELVLRCVAGMQDKLPTGGKLEDDFLSKELDKDPLDKSNYIVRSLFINQQNLIEKFAKDYPEPSALSSIPWQAIADNFKTFMDDWGQGAHSYLLSLNRLLSAFSVNIVDKIQNTVKMNGVVVPRVLTVMAGGNQAGLVIVEKGMTRLELMNFITETIERNNPNLSLDTKNVIRQNLPKQIDSLHGKDIYQKGTIYTKQKMLLMIEVEKLQLLGADIKGRIGAMIYSEKLATLINFKAFPRWRDLLMGVIEKNTSKLPNIPEEKLARASGHFGVASVIFQVAMLTQFLTDEKSSILDGTDSAQRFWGNSLIATSTGIGAIESYAPKMMEVLKPYLRTFIYNSGRLLGAVGAFWIAILDWKKAELAKINGDEYAFRWLRFSAIGGAMIGASLLIQVAIVGKAIIAASAVAILGSVAFVLGIVGIAVVFITAIFLFFDDDDLQKWIQRSIFGDRSKTSLPMFPTGKMEMEALDAMYNKPEIEKKTPDYIEGMKYMGMNPM